MGTAGAFPYFSGFLILTFGIFRAPANPPCPLNPPGAAVVQPLEKSGVTAFTQAALQILRGKEKGAIKAPSKFLWDSHCAEGISG